LFYFSYILRPHDGAHLDNGLLLLPRLAHEPIALLNLKVSGLVLIRARLVIERQIDRLGLDGLINGDVLAV